MRRLHRPWAMVLLVVGAMLAARAQAAGEPESQPAKPPAERQQPTPSNQLGLYDHPYKDGLYSTILGQIAVGAPPPEDEKKLKLKIDGFKKEVEVRAVLQEQPAPLVVVLIGGDGQDNSPMGQLWPYLLDRHAKWNVMYMDSTFRPTFANITRVGVTGNMISEAELMAKVIAEFLKNDEVKKRAKITKVGLLGYSMGGSQAMIMAHMAAEGKLPFELNGALAFSPPVKLRATAEILDDWYKTDRWKQTVVQMALDLGRHEPVEPEAKTPYEDWQMRGVIGYLIREQFTEIVDKNDSIYRLKQIPDEASEPGVNRVSHARAWGFQRYMELMCYPYWQKKGSFKSIDELWDAGNMVNVMQKLPDYAFAIEAEDDPLNRSEDLKELASKVDKKHLVVIPRGGHYGYFFKGLPWCYQHVVGMFERNK